MSMIERKILKAAYPLHDGSAKWAPDAYQSERQVSNLVFSFEVLYGCTFSIKSSSELIVYIVKNKERVHTTYTTRNVKYQNWFQHTRR